MFFLIINQYQHKLKFGNGCFTLKFRDRDIPVTAVGSAVLQSYSVTGIFRTADMPKNVYCLNGIIYWIIVYYISQKSKRL